MKISIITPSYQAADRIGRTVSSIVEGARRAEGMVEIHYCLVDGGSSDRTVEGVRALIADAKVGNLQFEIISERDEGMYDALGKGLGRADGDVHAYINAGDYYSPDVFRIISDVFSRFKDLDWITGLQVEYNDRGHMTSARLPFRFRPGLIRRGAYDGRCLPLLQQESTFWRATLTQMVDFSVLRTLRYAGDFYLWKTFATQAEPRVVEAWLGGFAFHRGQLSEDRGAYLSEMKKLAEPALRLDWLRVVRDRVMWNLPRSWKWRMGRGWLIVFDRAVGGYRSL